MSDNSNNLDVATVYLYGPKAKEGVLERVKPAGILVNTLYLQDTLGVRKLDPFRAFVLESFHHLARMDGDGKLEAARPYVKGSKTPGFYDRFSVLLLVSAGSQLIPATYHAFKGMARPFEKLEDQDKTQLAPELLTERGAEWLPAATAKDERGRQVLSLSAAQEGKNKYNVGLSRTFAPTEAEVERFNAFIGTDKHKALGLYWAKVIEGIEKKYTEQ